MKRKAKAWHSLYVSVMLAALCSCMADTRHLVFASIGDEGWAQTDTLNFVVAPLNGTGKSGVSLLLHTDGYEYENIALNIAIWQDSALLYHEPRSYRLSDNEPKRGIARRCDYALPIGNFTLCDTMSTMITLTHQLDCPVLKGVRKVGIRIGEPKRQPGEIVWEVDW